MSGLNLWGDAAHRRNEADITFLRVIITAIYRAIITSIPRIA